MGSFGNPGGAGTSGLVTAMNGRQLVLLVRQLVGTPQDWKPINTLNAGLNLGGAGPGGTPLEEDPNTDPDPNDLAYYAAAGALIVKGTSRIHSRSTSRITVGAQGLNPPPPLVRLGPDQEAPDRKNRDPARKGEGSVAAAGGGHDDKDGRSRTLPADLSNLDPRTMWQEALAKGVDDPGLIIAVADFLALQRKFDHAAEFLKANLREDLVVRPWVYTALAVALRETNAAPEDIERAEVSAADLEPLDAQGFVRAAQALRELRHYQRAVAFCRQAALLEPEQPDAYAEALASADEGKDPQAMAWAAGNLLHQDWVVDNQDLQTRALSRLEGLAKALEKENRRPEAQQLRSALSSQRQRDLVIKLTWQGQADLDLKVQEPTGTVCWWANRMTVGGGTLLGDTLAEPTNESYVAAEGFPGKYVITVEQAWGRPLGDKAQLLILENQGTPFESARLETIDLKRGSTIVVDLQNGRRTTVAVVPPEAALRHQGPKVEQGCDRIYTALRQMADETAVSAESGLRGGVAAFGVRVDDPKQNRSTGDARREGRVAYQRVMTSCVDGSADLTAQAVISTDGREVKVTMTGLFDMFKNASAAARVNNPLIPGLPKP